ncbi:MAG: HD domain-containing protein [Actinobacteria bacterium]|nr:MAG: HD domain-containing protein [Actinomycetota bacterium]
MTREPDTAYSSRDSRGLWWGVAAVSTAVISLGTAIVVSHGGWNLPLALEVGLAAAVTAALGLRLPRGDVVRVDALAASAALALLAPAAGMITLFFGCLTGMYLSRRMTRSSPVSVLVDSSRHVTALGLAYLVKYSAVTLSLTEVALAGLAIAVYACVELSSLAAQQAFTSATGYSVVAGSMFRSVWQIYLGQACLGIALAVVYPSMGAWAIPVMTILGAILLNGFALYLRVKIAYQETIAALAKVSELHLANRRGHSERVANMAVSVGRRLAMTPHSLEALNYAALLHEIGSLGRDFEDPAAHEDVAGWAEKGAEILRAVPFLEDAAEMVSCQHEVVGASRDERARVSQIGGAIIRACCVVEDELRGASESGELSDSPRLVDRVNSAEGRIPEEILRAVVLVAEQMRVYETRAVPTKR